MQTKKCKQCGKEFTLTDGEIEFYRSKGLNIPNRCEACRKANRAEKNGKSSDINKSGVSAVIPIVIVIVVVIAAAIRNFLPTAAPVGNDPLLYETEAAESVYVNEEKHEDTISVSEEVIEDKITENEVTENEVAENIVTEQDIVTESLPELTFRNQELLESHFLKHGVEMGFETAEDYRKAAEKAVLSPDALHKTEAEDGDDVYYIESTNEFVVVSTDGYIRTYFYPDSGKAYFDKQ